MIDNDLCETKNQSMISLSIDTRPNTKDYSTIDVILPQLYLK